MDSKLRNKIKNKIFDYCENSTTHGVRYLGLNTHWVNKSTWLVIILGSFTLCVCLSTIIWNNFDQNPTVTVVETTHYPTTNIRFPAVVICDSHRVHTTNTLNVSDILTKRGFNTSLIEAFFETLPWFNTHHPMNDAIVKIHELLADMGITTTSLLEMYATPCHILLLECYWRSVQYNCSDMFQIILYHTGYCCRFDISYFRKNAPSGTNLASGHQNSEALRFVVNRNLEDTSGIQKNHEDVEIYIFPSKNPLTVTESSTILTRQTSLDFNIDVWIIDTSDGVKELPKQSRQCLLPVDSYREAGYFRGCISEGFHSEVLYDCNCIPFYYSSTIIRNLPNCTWEQHFCIFRAIEKLKGNIADVASRYSCYPDCDHVQYETEVDYIRQTRFLNTSDNNTKVMVHFYGNSCVKYRRDLLFTWDQLLASLGGLFGLCTGGSILSVIELLYYIFDVILLVVYNWLDYPDQKKKTKKPMHKIKKKLTNKIFTIEKNINLPYID